MRNARSSYFLCEDAYGLASLSEPQTTTPERVRSVKKLHIVLIRVSHSLKAKRPGRVRYSPLNAIKDEKRKKVIEPSLKLVFNTQAIENRAKLTRHPTDKLASRKRAWSRS